jgi:hypothetical protein
MLSVVFEYCYAECLNAECCYAECHYAECLGSPSLLGWKQLRVISIITYYGINYSCKKLNSKVPKSANYSCHLLSFWER